MSHSNTVCNTAAAWSPTISHKVPAIPTRFYPPPILGDWTARVQAASQKCTCLHPDRKAFSPAFCSDWKKRTDVQTPDRIATDIFLHRSRQTIERLTKIHRMRTIIDVLITSKGEHHRSSNTSRTSDNVSGIKSEANLISYAPNFRRMPEVDDEIGADDVFTSINSTLASSVRSFFNRRIQRRTFS